MVSRPVGPPPLPRIDRTRLAAAAVTLSFVLVALAPALVFARLRVTDARVNDTDQLAESVGRVDALMTDQESGERGYVITADPSFLTPYQQGRAQLDALWAIAEGQAAAIGGRAPALLAAVRQSATAWQIQAAEPEITLVQSGDAAAAARLIASGFGKARFDQFRGDRAALATALQQLRTAHEHQRDRILAVLTGVLIGVALLGLASLGLLVYLTETSRRAQLAAVRSETARAAVEHEQAFLQSVLQQMPLGVVIAEAPAGRITFANDQAAPLLHGAAASRADEDHGDRVLPDDGLHPPEADWSLARTLATGTPITGDERDYIRADGTRVVLRANAAPVRDDAGQMVAAVLTFEDVTDRKRAEAELHASRDQLAAVFHSVSEGITVQDATGRLRYANDAIARLTGAASAEAMLATPMAGALARFDLVDEAGQPYPHDRLPGRRVLRGEPVPPLTLGFRSPETGEQRWVVITSTPVFDERGQGTLVVNVFRDITAQRRQQVEREQLLLQEQAARAAAQAALATRDAFVAGISHDLKSPLAAIKGQAQLLRRRMSRMQHPEAAPLAEGLGRIDATVVRMTALLDELVDTVRLEAGQALDLHPQPIDLVALVREGIDEIQRATERHPIRLAPVAGAVTGAWDPARLTRVVTNLLSNAVKYSPRGGEILVTVARADPAAGEAEGAMLSVQDHGLGIPAADLPHIFERFHRGANVGAIAGSGIGLAGVKQIVEQHGGTIAVTSCEGAGTTVTVRLPLDAPESA